MYNINHPLATCGEYGQVLRSGSVEISWSYGFGVISELVGCDRGVTVTRLSHADTTGRSWN